jgi:hypothetical protein
VGIRHADHLAPSICKRKLALTSPTSGGRSVGIVRYRTRATEFCFFFVCAKYFRNWLHYRLQGIDYDADRTYLHFMLNYCGIDNREYGRIDPSRWHVAFSLSAKVGTSFADKRRSLSRYSSLMGSGNGIFVLFFTDLVHRLGLLRQMSPLTSALSYLLSYIFLLSFIKSSFQGTSQSRNHPEYENKPGFRNVFSSYLEFRTMHKDQEPGSSEWETQFPE